MSGGYGTQFLISAATYADPVALNAKQATEVMAARRSGHMIEGAPDILDAPIVQQPWDTDDEAEEPRFRPATEGETPTHWFRTLTFARAAPTPPEADTSWLAGTEKALDAYILDDTDTTGWDHQQWLADAMTRVTSPAGVYALLPQHVQTLVDEVRVKHAALPEKGLG